MNFIRSCGCEKRRQCIPPHKYRSNNHKAINLPQQNQEQWDRKWMESQGHSSILWLCQINKMVITFIITNQNMITTILSHVTKRPQQYLQAMQIIRAGQDSWTVISAKYPKKAYLQNEYNYVQPNCQQQGGHSSVIWPCKNWNISVNIYIFNANTLNYTEVLRSNKHTT